MVLPYPKSDKVLGMKQPSVHVKNVTMDLKKEQGVLLFLPPPYFLMCQNGEEKNRVQNLPPLKNGPVLGWQVVDSAIFGGGKF
jgi:hypothetical protein